MNVYIYLLAGVVGFGLLCLWVGYALGFSKGIVAYYKQEQEAKQSEALNEYIDTLWRQNG